MNQPMLINAEQTENLIEQLWRNNQHKGEPIVYAILDSARNKKIYPLLCASEARFYCLYDGELDYGMASVAPYLVCLQKNADFTRQLIQQAWGNSWGVFAITYAPTIQYRVRENCKKVLFAVNESEQGRLLFRYYDPRVLSTYLPQSTTESAVDFFGPISEFIVEAPFNENTPLQHHRFIQTEQGIVDINANLNKTNPNKANLAIVPINPQQALEDTLSLSSLQISAFEKARLKAFFKQMQRHLITTFFDEFIEKGNTQQQLKWVEDNSLHAISLGFKNKTEIYRYLNVAVLHGDAFHQQSWAKDILDSPYQTTTKAMQLEAASIEQLALQKDNIQIDIEHNKEDLLKAFYQTHKAKIQTIGNALYALHLNSDTDIKNWLYQVAQQCIHLELYDDLEMDIWLDLSMRHGENFSRHTWAKTILQKDHLAPEQKLQQLIDNAPATPSSRADLTLVVTRN